MTDYNCFNRSQRVDEAQLTQNAGKILIKNGGKKDKEYSIEWIQKTCTIEYKGKMKDRGILKWVPFINTLGKTAVQITAWSSVILSVCIFFIVLPTLPENLYLMLLIGFVFLSFFIVGLGLFSYVKYVKATRCKICNKNYAYEETANPDVREVSTENSYTVAITRYWKCKRCGYIDSDESPEDIVTRKGKIKKPKRIICEKCGKSGIYPEYKTPDIKSNESIFTRIRYYKCEYCRHINIEVEEAYSGEDSSGWENKGSDPRL